MSTKLPPQPTPFVGRADELGELARLLADDNCRLLTLVGPGGIGKTRLALEAARHFNALQGIYFVALQPIESPNLIVSAIGEALDFQFFQGDARAQLLD
jgi:predicted ATPase